MLLLSLRCKLATELIGRRGHETCNNVARLLRLQQPSSLLCMHECVVDGLVHGVGPRVPDELLHVGVDTAGLDGDACNVFLLDGKMP